MHRSVIAFEELRQGIKDIEYLSDPTAGEVRIGSTDALAASFVSAVIDQLSRRYPGISFHVVTGTAKLLRRELAERGVDLLILRDRGSIADEQRSFEFLFESPHVVAAGANNTWVGRRRVKLAQLLGELWTLPPPDGEFGTFIMEAFRASGLEFPRAAVVALTFDMRANLLKTGRFLSVFPEFWLRLPDPHPFISRLPVEFPIASRPIGIVTLKNRALNPVARLFIECAREVAKSLARRK
jgi:DNA-binding transcriptional LysR family regulator